MITRRKVLKLIGGGVILSATGLAGCAVLEGPSQSARVAWRNASQEPEFRRRALSYALLAPNPHNRQPWLVELVGEDSLTLYCDLARLLPDNDRLWCIFGTIDNCCCARWILNTTYFIS